MKKPQETGLVLHFQKVWGLPCFLLSVFTPADFLPTTFWDICILFFSISDLILSNSDMSNLLFTTSRLTNYQLYIPEICPHLFLFWSSRPRTCPASCWWRPAPLPGSLWPQCPARKDSVEISQSPIRRSGSGPASMHAQCGSTSQIFNNFTI